MSTISPKALDWKKRFWISQKDSKEGYSFSWSALSRFYIPMELFPSLARKKSPQTKRCHWRGSRCFLLELPKACREVSLRCTSSLSIPHCRWQSQNRRFSNFYGYSVCWQASNLDEVCSSSEGIWVLLEFRSWLRLQRLTEVFRVWTNSLAGPLLHSTRWW